MRGRETVVAVVVTVCYDGRWNGQTSAAGDGSITSHARGRQTVSEKEAENPGDSVVVVECYLL